MGAASLLVTGFYTLRWQASVCVKTSGWEELGVLPPFFNGLQWLELYRPAFSILADGRCLELLQVL